MVTLAAGKKDKRVTNGGREGSSEHHRRTPWQLRVGSPISHYKLHQRLWIQDYFQIRRGCLLCEPR